jgi:hypothetical protein
MKCFLLSIDWHIVRVGVVLLAMGLFKVIMETLIMLILKFDRFKKILIDSVMANIGLFLLVILLVLIFNKKEFDISQVTELSILYCISCIFEAWLIKLLNTTMSWAKIIVTSFVMNLLSFVSLYLIFTRFLAEFFSI